MKQVTRALLRNPAGKYLLVQHMNTDKWALPGGHIEKGESLHKALKREIFEEFHLHIKILGPCGKLKGEDIKSLPLPLAIYKIEYISNKGKHIKKTEYVFHAEVRDMSELQIQESEIRNHIWATPEEILEFENIFEQIPQLIQKVM